MLSQLSYSPIQLDHPSLINQARQQFASTNSLNPNPHSHMQMVGPGRLELPTPRLSSVCSNQLSYGPILPSVSSVQLDTHTGSASRRRSSGAPAECSPKGATARERKPKVYILLEERETWTANLAIPIRLPKQFRGVLRFDGHLTGAIYVLKSTGKFIPR